MTKITKRDIFSVILAAAENENIVIEGETEVTLTDIVTEMEKQIASLDKKAETAKAKAAEKKAAGDELRERVFAVVGFEPMTIAEVTEALGDEEVSANKVTYRLNALVEAGMLEKGEAKVAGSDGKSRTVKTFVRIAE